MIISINLYKMCKTSDFNLIVDNVKEVQVTCPVDTSSYHHYAIFFKSGRIQWWEKAHTDI